MDAWDDYRDKMNKLANALDTEADLLNNLAERCLEESECQELLVDALNNVAGSYSEVKEHLAGITSIS